MLELTRMEPLTVLCYNSRLLALLTNFIQVWKGMEEANTLAYYDLAKINDVKSFIVQALGANRIKLLTAVIYRYS